MWYWSESRWGSSTRRCCASSASSRSSAAKKSPWYASYSASPKYRSFRSAADTEPVAKHATSRSVGIARRMRITGAGPGLVPVPDVDRRLARIRARQRHADELGAHALVEREVLGPRVVLATRQLAVERDQDLMLPGREIAGVDPLHAAFLQRFQFLEAVDVMGGELPIDLYLHGVETERLARRQRDEHREMRVGRVEELLLQLVQVRRD